MHFDFRYADLLNDEVFKLVFGQESTKDVMIEFLNQVIPDRTIVDVEYMDKEMHPQEIERKTSVYDLFCMTDDGSRVIVELRRGSRIVMWRGCFTIPCIRYLSR